MYDKNNAKYWQKQLELATSNPRYREWLSKSNEIVRRYRNESFKPDSENGSVFQTMDNGYNLLYRNVSVRLPFILPYIPKVTVDRTNNDNDGIGRAAAMILERVVNKLVDKEEFKSALGLSKLDAELSNFGVIWTSYNPSITTEGLLKEDVKFEYINHNDFIWQKSKKWSDVEWVGKRLRLTEKDFLDRFKGKEEYINRDYDTLSDLADVNLVDERDLNEETTSVYEIWDKTTKKVYFYVPGSEKILDVVDYPYNITFPCTKPLSYDAFTDSTIPVSRHAQYLSQYKKVDALNSQINNLLDAINLRGAYDASIPDFGKIFDAANTNKLIGLKNIEKYQGKALNDMLWLYDPMPIAQAIDKLKLDRDTIIQDIQKGLGIYDTLEGQTNPQEAYGTNRLKGSFGTMRLQDDQKDAIYFVQDTIRIACEIIAQIFEPLSLIQYSTIEYTTETLDSIYRGIALLKDDLLKSFRISISLEDVRSYYDNDYKASISALWTDVFAQLQTSANIIQQIPEMAGICKEAIMSMVRANKVGTFVEQALESAINESIKMYIENQNTNKEPSIDQLKLQLEQEKINIEKMKVQNEAIKSQQSFEKELANDIEKAALENKRLRAEIDKITSDREIAEARLNILKQSEDRKDIELVNEIAANQHNMSIGAKADTNLGSVN